MWEISSIIYVSYMQLGHFLSSFATFFPGVLIAVICCWEVSLLIFLVVPMILVIGATYTKRMNAVSATKLLYLSEATSMIEQVIMQIHSQSLQLVIW